MQKVFDLANRYIILATPLILYTLFSSIYLMVALSGGKLGCIFFALILYFFMFGAFFSGWFNMVKVSIQKKSFEFTPNSILKEFFPGVGEYFLPFLGLTLITFLFLGLISTFIFIIGKNVIGNPGITPQEFYKALQNTETFRIFIAGLDPIQQIKIGLWNLLLMFGMTVGYFLLFLYIPVLFFKNKNPLKAFFISLKDTFSKHILKTSGVFLFIFVANFFISLLSSVFRSVAIIHFIFTLLNFYFIVVASIGTFYYYNKTFISSQIGQTVDVEV